MRSLIAATALTLLASTVALTIPASARDRDPPLATPIGAPVNCLQLRQIRETRVHGDKVIDFHMANNKVYRNTLPYSCPTLGFEERFSYATSESELCSVDIISVLQTMGPGLTRGASCGLGQFQPVELVKRAKRER